MSFEIPVKVKNNLSIKEICSREGDLVFKYLNSGSLGHALYVNSVTLHTHSNRLEMELYSSALATDSVYNVVNVPYGVFEGSLVSYDGNGKSYRIVEIINKSAYYEITLSRSLGVAIAVGDTIIKEASSQPLQISFGTTYKGGFVTDQYTYSNKHVPINTSVTIPVDKLFSPSESLLIQVSSPEKDGFVSYDVSAYRVNADVNFNATYVVYALGDSTANPGGYIGEVGGHMHSVAVKSMNDGGGDYRLTTDQMSGKTSSHLIDSLKDGMKIIPQANLILFQHGINDAFQGTTDEEWGDNLDYMIWWRDRNYPDAKLVFVGATPISNNAPDKQVRLAELAAIQATKADASREVYYFGITDYLVANYPEFDYTSESFNFSDGVHPTHASNKLYGLILGRYLRTIPSLKLSEYTEEIIYTEN